MCVFDELVNHQNHTLAYSVVCVSVNYAIYKAPVYPEFHRVAQKVTTALIEARCVQLEQYFYIPAHPTKTHMHTQTFLDSH